MSNKQARNIRDKYAPKSPYRNRLMIGMCVYEVVFAKFFEHFLSIQGWADTQCAVSRSAYLPDSHNRIIKGALELDNWDYLVFIEQDTLPPVQILHHMRYYSDPIIASLYFSKQMPPQPIAYHDDGENIHNLTAAEMVPMLEKPGLYPVDVAPMGCTAIRRDVLKAMADGPRLWFDTSRRSDGGLVSDDVWFCRYARQLGYQPLLNTVTICKHVGHWEVDDNVYRAWLRREIAIGKEDGLLGEAAKRETQGIQEPVTQDIPRSSVGNGTVSVEDTRGSVESLAKQTRSIGGQELV